MSYFRTPSLRFEQLRETARKIRALAIPGRKLSTSLSTDAGDRFNAQLAPVLMRLYRMPLSPNLCLG
jgi:hypothetical protein